MGKSLSPAQNQQVGVPVDSRQCSEDILPNLFIESCRTTQQRMLTPILIAQNGICDCQAPKDKQ